MSPRNNPPPIPRPHIHAPRGCNSPFRDSPPHSDNIRVRGSSNGLTNHPGGDVYRGLLMHAGLLLLLSSSPHRGVGTHLQQSSR